MQNKENSPKTTPPTRKELTVLFMCGLLTFVLGIMMIFYFTSGASGDTPLYEDVEYKKYTADDLINDYVSIPKAKEEHGGEYVKIKGVLQDIYASDEEIQMTGLNQEKLLNYFYIDCYSTKKKHVDIIDEMNDGDVITIKGKVIDVNHYCYTVAIHEAEITKQASQEKQKDNDNETVTAVEGKGMDKYDVIYLEEPLTRPFFFF